MAKTTLTDDELFKAFNSATSQATLAVAKRMARELRDSGIVVGPKNQAKIEEYVMNRVRERNSRWAKRKPLETFIIRGRRLG